MDFGRESGDVETAQKLIYDYAQAGFSVEDNALCEFAEKLTRSPGKVSAKDVERLRQYGFSDDQISVATQVIGYFNYINRIADGLGVDPEPEMESLVDVTTWKREKRQSFV